MGKSSRIAAGSGCFPPGLFIKVEGKGENLLSFQLYRPFFPKKSSPYALIPVVCLGDKVAFLGKKDYKLPICHAPLQTKEEAKYYKNHRFSSRAIDQE